MLCFLIISHLHENQILIYGGAFPFVISCDRLVQKCGVLRGTLQQFAFLFKLGAHDANRYHSR